MTFTFRRIATALDIRRIATSDAAFTRLRRRMVDDLGIDARQADRILDDMLARALTRFGDHFVLGRSELLDQVIHLRDRLDGLYHEILNFDGAVGRKSTARVQGAARPSIKDQLTQIETLYRDLDDRIRALSAPPEDLKLPPATARDVAAETMGEVAKATPTPRRPGHSHRDVVADRLKELGRRFSRLHRKGFRPHPPGQDVTFRRTFADGSTADFTIEGGVYKVTTRDASGLETTFREYDLLSSPYGRRPLTTSLVQAHHGLQNSLMTRIFGRFGYSGDAAPTIWLRNSRRGSPHGAITAAQNSAKALRETTATTLSEIRRLAIEDLRLTHMPEDMITAYLLAFDSYFEKAVLPRMSAADRTRFLGSWKPPSGGTP